MTETTCRETGCAEAVYIKKRGLCKSHYFERYRAGDFGRTRTEARWHRTSDVDVDAMTGTCAVCGPGAGLLRHKDRLVCGTANRWHRYRYRHNLSQTDIEAMLDEIGWRCPICRIELDQTFAIDHDHGCCPGRRSCGKCVRGILCIACNTGIGMFHDDPATVRAAVEYLEKSLV